MKLIVHEKPLYFYEACRLLEMLAKEGSPGKLGEELKLRYSLETGDLEEILEELEGLYEGARGLVDLEDQRATLLFEEQEDLPEPLWTVLAELLELGDRGIPAFGHSLREYFDEWKSPGPKNEDEAIREIMGRDLSYEAQSKLILLLLRLEELLLYLEEAGEEVERLLRGKAKSLERITGNAMGRIRREVDSHGLEGLFHAFDLPVTMEGNEECEIYPLLFPSNAIVLRERGDGTGLRLFWGVNIIAIGELQREERLSTQRLLEVLKALSDKTKLDMLATLSREELYGAQIAQRMELTTATISYHIKQLTSLRLLHIVKRENRIYYRTDRQRLREYLEECGKLFDGDS